MMDAGIPLPNNWYRISYFHCSLFGYFLGLLTATISSEVSCLKLTNQIRNVVEIFESLQHSAKM